MSGPPVLRDHTDAVLAALEGLDLLVGDAKAPDAEPPYVVVYPVPGGEVTGTLAAPDDDATLVYQVTCVGRSREQVEWLVDKSYELLGGRLEVEGRRLMRIRKDSNPGVRRDDDATPPVFYATPRFRLTTTPA